ncbi:MAG TPA: M20/M25/M40 family metallo-hydrolase [Acidimicrobiia bacterium]|nr:M20/M25/M40 family metallo-hydrolase [Acidimicrobiia bacterium]
MTGDVEAAGQDIEALVAMTCDLVDIPSETGSEAAVAEYVGGRFAEIGLAVEYQEVEPERRNVLARWKGAAPGPRLMFLAHFDTSTSPGERLPSGLRAEATVEDGWIRGLGVSNMKSAFAAFHSAIQLLQRSGGLDRGEILVAGVVGEIERAPVDEWQGKRFRGGGIGARVMLNRGVTADWCINGEPTGLRLQTGNAGYVFARISVHGSPQHTFSKSLAIDPIEKATRIRSRLLEFEETYIGRHPDPVMKPLLNVGAIFGGDPFKPSLTARTCNLYVHINTIPGQQIGEVRAEFEEFLAEQRATDPDLDVELDFYLASNGHYLEPDHPLPQAVARAHESVFGAEVGRPNPERYSVSSDNSPLAEFGIPGITYGAGGINLSGDYSMYEPGLGEVVSIENLAGAARVYAAAARNLI